MTSAINGGLDSLIELGVIDVHNVSHRASTREWATTDNGNPANMLGFVRDIMGADDEVLFIVERDFNRNVVLYRPTLTYSGDLDTTQIVNAGWLMISDEADLDDANVAMDDDAISEEAMTSLEELGYGVNVINGSNLCFAIRALPDVPLFLVQNAKGQWRARIEIKGQMWVLHRIFITTTPRSFGFPKVSELHLEVCDVDTDAIAQFFYALL